MKIKCQFCDKEYSKAGLGTHIWRSHGAGKSHKPRLGAKAWNSGLTAETDHRVATYSKTMVGKCTGFSSTDEGEEIRRQKISVAAQRNGLGGHTSKKQLWFQKADGSVVFLQSSYETKFAMILEDLAVEWTRPVPFQWIDANGKNHRYYPDFKIGNIFVDTKNDYLIEKDAEKIRKVCEQNNIEIHVVPFANITTEFVVRLLRGTNPNGMGIDCVSC